MTTALLMFLASSPITLGDHVLGGAALQRRERLLRRRAAHHRLAERPRRGRRLHERGVVSRIAGLIAFNGYDGFMYSVGWLVAYLTVLLIVAEPLRNAGKYTMADVLAYRLQARARCAPWRR